MRKSYADLSAAYAMAKTVLIGNQILKPPVDIKALIESEGLSILLAVFEDNYIVSGIIDLDEGRVILNEDEEPYVRNFTLARMLGHLLLHEDELFEIPELKIIYDHSLGGNLKNFYEKEAIHFGMHLLLPDELFNEKRHLSSGALEEIFHVPPFLIKERLERA